MFLVLIIGVLKMNREEIKEHLIAMTDKGYKNKILYREIQDVDIHVIIASLKDAISEQPDKFEQLMLSYNNLFLYAKKLHINTLEMPTAIKNSLISIGVIDIGCLLRIDIRRLSIHGLGDKGKEQIVNALLKCVYKDSLNESFQSIIKKAKKFDYIKNSF